MLTVPLVWASLMLGLLESGETVFRPTPRESSVPKQFRLQRESYRYELKDLMDTERYRVSSLQFPSPIITPDPENNIVHAEYFEPRGFAGRRPAVVVLHILGSDFPLSRYMAARLADRGVAALFLKLPYYGERRPQSEANSPQTARRFLSANIERSVTSMRQGVCDVRRAIGWLTSRPEVDPDRLGVAGISLGGIIASIVASVDPTVREGVFLLAGGDLSRILWEMPESAKYREAWQASGRTINDLKSLTDPLDPLTHAAGLKGKRILMMAGKVDEVVPPSCVHTLWNAAGRPPIHWFDCGHYSSIGYLLPALRMTVDFLAGSPEAAGSK